MASAAVVRLNQILAHISVETGEFGGNCWTGSRTGKGYRNDWVAFEGHVYYSTGDIDGVDMRQVVRSIVVDIG